MLVTLAHYLLDMTVQIGYIGIFIALFLVFTFIPLPSQVVLIPAGYLSQQGTLELWWVIGSGTLGGIGGAHFNYFLAHYFGRDFVLKYGHYFLIKESLFKRLEKFFEVHGAFSVAIAFISPGIGQLASLPAGVAGMDRRIFFFAAVFGAFVWNCMMVFTGYYFGAYQEWIFDHIFELFVGLFLIMMFIAALYFYYHYLKNGKKHI